MSLNNPKQTLKRMVELIGLLGAQLDVLCRRHEDALGPNGGNVPTVSTQSDMCDTVRVGN